MPIKTTKEQYHLHTQDGRYNINLTIDYKAKNFTITNSKDQSRFVFLNTSRNTTPMLDLIKEAQELALSKLGLTKVEDKQGDTDKGEAKQRQFTCPKDFWDNSSFKERNKEDAKHKYFAIMVDDEEPIWWSNGELVLSEFKEYKSIDDDKPINAKTITVYNPEGFSVKVYSTPWDNIPRFTLKENSIAQMKRTNSKWYITSETFCPTDTTK